MAIAPSSSNTYTPTAAANFIPELWANEVLAARDKNLVATKLFRSYPHNGKKGDTIHIPNVSHLSANDKSAYSAVTLQATTESKVDISINKHKETSFLIEDITEAQAQYNLRSIYTREAGYAIAKQLDTDLLEEVTGNITTTLDGDGTAATDAGAAFTKAGLLEADYYLNAADVPNDKRFIIIHPIHRKTILGIADFVQHQYSGAMAQDIMMSGSIGQLMGYNVYMSTNVPTTVSDETDGYVILVGHMAAAAAAVQKAPRTQAQYRQDYLATLVTCDTLYGVKTLRADHCVGLRTPTS